MVGKGNTKANLLHKHTSNIVKEHIHAGSHDRGHFYPHLTEEESDVYHRGRNAKSPSMAKTLQWLITGKLQGFGGGHGLSLSEG